MGRHTIKAAHGCARRRTCRLQSSAVCHAQVGEFTHAQSFEAGPACQPAMGRGAGGGALENANFRGILDRRANANF
jgi:hypothetical protein